MCLTIFVSSTKKKIRVIQWCNDCQCLLRQGNFDTAIGIAFCSRENSCFEKLGYSKLFIKFATNRDYLCF